MVCERTSFSLIWPRSSLFLWWTIGGADIRGGVRIKKLLVVRVSANPRASLFSRSKKKISFSAFYFPAYSNPIGHVRDIEKTTTKK